jgi:hypothetical protein
MAVGSIVLAALSLVSIGLGVLTTPIPVVGAIFSFGAPTLAIAGVITGGLAMSRARRENRSRDLALAGVITSAICFVPALITALTCGVCNALCSTGRIETRRDFHFNIQQGTGGSQAGRAGQGGSAEPLTLPPPPGGKPRAPSGHDAGPRDAPPPAFPPPPIDERPP